MNETEIILGEEMKYNESASQQYSVPSQEPAAAPVRPLNPPGYGFSVAGMVCGIVSLVMFWPFGFAGGILGIVFSLVSRRGGKMNGMARAGLICGILGLVLFLALLAWMIGIVVVDIHRFGGAGMLV